MSDIYALKGKGNSGKSETIKFVYSELIQKYPSATIQQLSTGTQDIKAILSNIKGHTIGIESQGDPSSRLQQSLQDFAKANCTIIFCATRTRGMTVTWVNSMAGQYSIHFIPQTYVTTNFSINNLQMANNIITRAGL